jgi:hypothetical protein
METYRITRCKMGFRSIADMPEWMIIMEFKDMGQMDSAFKRVAHSKGRTRSQAQSHSISLCQETFNMHCLEIGQIPT